MGGEQRKDCFSISVLRHGKWHWVKTITTTLARTKDKKVLMLIYNIFTTHFSFYVQTSINTFIYVQSIESSLTLKETKVIQNRVKKLAQTSEPVLVNYGGRGREYEGHFLPVSLSRCFRHPQYMVSLWKFSGRITSLVISLCASFFFFLFTFPLRYTLTDTRTEVKMTRVTMTAMPPRAK